MQPATGGRAENAGMGDHGDTGTVLARGSTNDQVELAAREGEIFVRFCQVLARTAKTMRWKIHSFTRWGSTRQIEQQSFVC